MKILYIFPNPRSHLPRYKILKECRKNNFPDTLLLGLNRLNNYGIEYGMSDSCGCMGKIKQSITTKDYDLIVCKDASSGLLLGILKKWSLIKKPLIFLDIVVHENIQGVKLKFLRYILSCADKVIYCASSLKGILKEYFNLGEEVLKYVPWSVDNNFFHPLELQQESFIFSAGDNDRDYITLIEAVENTGLELKIATGLPIKKGCSLIEIMPRLHPCVLREEYARARFVVVPLYDVPSASGATALLESMAMAKAVIVSGSCGIRDFVIDGYNGIVVRPQDILSLRNAIIYLNKNPKYAKRLGGNARMTVEKYFGTEKQADSLVKIYREVLKKWN